MQMKTTIRMFIALAAFIPALAVQALESRQMSVPEGRSATHDLGFVPTGYKQQSGKDAVSVTLAEGASSVTVTGIKEGGRSQIEFPDPSGEGVLLTVDVISDLELTLRELRKRLSDFDDLTCSRGNRKILVEGTIGNPSDWEKFNRILKLSDFAGKVESLVQFRVDPSMIGALRKDMEEAGFTVVPPGTKPEKGQVALKYDNNVLTVSGNVWSDNEMNKIRAVLAQQTWLRVVEQSSEDAAKKPVVETVISATVDSSLMEVAVAFIKVSRTASRNINRDKNGLDIGFLWNGFYDFLTGRHRSAENFRIDADLNSAINMLAENGAMREKQQGTFRIHANGDAGKTLHIGGSMKVTPPASAEGEAPEAQDYDYGFKVVNKNTRRLGEDFAEVDVNFELFGYPIFQSISGNTIVDQQKSVYAPTVRCPFGKTVAVAGFENLKEGVTQPSGTPFLRNVPVLNWFFAKQGEDTRDETVLMLVSVRIVDQNDAPMFANDEMPDITYDANQDGGLKKVLNDEEKAKSKYHGCWTPLNWFRW